jgi:uncharacterized protein
MVREWREAPVSKIEVEHDPSADRLKQLGVEDWPIWTKEESEFAWTYDEQEVCYLLDGRVVVTPQEGGESVTIVKGDLATFPAGMKCSWKVIQKVRKHYWFG